MAGVLVCLQCVIITLMVNSRCKSRFFSNQNQNIEHPALNKTNRPVDPNDSKPVRIDTAGDACVPID